ncbi:MULTISPECIES: hypothetical protein [Streptomyces]|nr:MULTISPECIES: hypothetical protein [Streptomyces]
MRGELARAADEQAVGGVEVAVTARRRWCAAATSGPARPPSARLDR